MNFAANELIPPGAKIKVFGIGGGGGNAVNTMIRSGLEGVDFISANSDIQSLRFSLATRKVQIGKELTKGLGAGSDPDIGREAALEDRQEILEALNGADMVFLTAGMGGGTGTGGIPVIAQLAREIGALTVAVVTTPFSFEGKRRKRYADLGIARLRESVDTLITIPNERLLRLATPQLSMTDAFKLADDVLLNAVRGVSDIINIPGIINVDFADVRTVMSGMGQALMGIGMASGEGRALAAARQAISSPLLEDMDIEGATGILINITAGSNLALLEINESCSIIQEAAHEDANIIFGAVLDEAMGEAIRITVIATGFPVEVEHEDHYEFKKDKKTLVSEIVSNIGIPNVAPKNPPTPTATVVAPSRVEGTRKEPSITATATSHFEEKKPSLSDSSNISPESEAQELARLTMGELLRGEIPSRVSFRTDDDQTDDDQGMDPMDPSDPLTIEQENKEEFDTTSSAEPALFLDPLDREQKDESLEEPAISENIDNDTFRVLSEEELATLELEFRQGVNASEQPILQNSSNAPLRTIEGASFDKDLGLGFGSFGDLKADLDVDLTTDFSRVEERKDSPTFDQSHNEPQAEFNRSEAIRDENVETVSFSFDQDGPNGLTDVNPSSEKAGNEFAPIEAFFDAGSEAANFVHEIDKKIDAALQMTERLPNKISPRSEGEISEGDDVDVPTFLRNGIKDLPID